MAVSRVDPAILAVFGPPPKHLDLNESLALRHDIVVCLFYGFAAVFLGLRIWLCSTPIMITNILGGSLGAGRHVWSLNFVDSIKLVKVVYSEAFLFGLAVTGSKISILLLYRSIFACIEDQFSTFRVLFWIATTVNLLYPVIMWITMAVACRPISVFWEQYAGVEGGECINVTLFFLIFGIVNMLNDILVLAVPIPEILRLQLSRSKKISIICIMLLGAW
ncbi:hypothetical protein BHE90_009745 [Fusarium euwallaceae]|uniref:Rhodopsin domain-containing protein n=2 Tax=Fusarium solani species complex TaxID=232080 RepID=A0A430LJD9_9HYPO|nr:hypothetical protein CEP51_007576 [Fusarium floridanum]RTE75824.1 hypothetical protein BHE90_009745 [Fusarium euwallaceae]